MGLWFLIVISILFFILLTVLRKWHDIPLLYCIAIGCAVNANIYTSLNTGVVVGPIVFSIDSVLYTMFTFTVIICAIDYSTKQASTLSSSTIAAIILSAFIEFAAMIFANGYKDQYLNTFLGYLISAFGTFVGIFVMILVIIKLKAKINIYLLIIIACLIASIINSTIYYVIVLIIDGNSNFIGILLGSYIGKIFAILLSLISYFVNKNYLIPNELKKDRQV